MPGKVAEIHHFHENPPIFTNSNGIPLKWWVFMKMSEMLTFCSPGGLKTYRICMLFVGLGAGARESSRKPPFSWKSAHFGGIPLKLLEMGGFPWKWWFSATFPGTCSQPYKKHAYSIGSGAPLGSKKWEFHSFHDNSPVFVDSHKHLLIFMKMSEILTFCSPGGLQNL